MGRIRHFLIGANLRRTNSLVEKTSTNRNLMNGMGLYLSVILGSERPLSVS
jgi:hypothetical protein